LLGNSGMSRIHTLALVAVLGACIAGDDEDDVPVVEPTYLSPVAHLHRASMALRGVKPRPEDLDRVAANPAELEAVVDAYLDSPEFGKVVRDLHNEALLLRTDYFYYPAGFKPIAGLAGEDSFYLNRSIQEAALRLIEHVVMNDRPYTEIVTADYLIANRVVATVWGSMGYDPAGPEWQVTQWNDGRPRAGILSDPWVFSRHNSTPSNANRGRANAISKALLCYDFLSRDIEIDASINLADPEMVKNAVVDNDACASCHQALDPLAAFFADYFPIYVADQFTTYPFKNNFITEQGLAIDFYMPGLGVYYFGELRDPAYFGDAGQTVTDLGRMMANDPRLSLCAAKRFYAYFHQVDVDDVALEAIAPLQDTFIRSGFNAKELAKAIVLDKSFAASHADDAELSETLVGVLKTRPDQLGSMIEDLTGFRWQLDPALELGQVELTGDSFVGFQVIGGGIDAAYVTQPAHTFNVTSSLLFETLAAEAAAHVVATDSLEPDATKRRLFLYAHPNAGSADEIRAQLAYLHKRLFAEMVEPGSPEVKESFDLFMALLNHSNDMGRAWQGVLTAMLQDIRVASY
jgi:hypothetical protein